MDQQTLTETSKPKKQCSGQYDDSRDPCVLCCCKHLAQAHVLIKETHKEYPHHKWIAMGHMAEAEDEVMNAHPHMALAIRSARLSYQNEDVEPDCIELLDLVLISDEELATKILEEMNINQVGYSTC